MELIQYTVRPGNTLFGIAQFFNTTVQDILMFNNLKTTSDLRIGQVLTIPAGLTDGEFYVVRPGDTLWNIAERYGITVAELINMNMLINPNIIYPGQILKIK